MIQTKSDEVLLPRLKRVVLHGVFFILIFQQITSRWRDDQKAKKIGRSQSAGIESAIDILQILFKQRVRVIVELKKVGYACMAGIGRVIVCGTTTIITPNQYIT